MTQTFKQWLARLLCCVMLLACLPASAMAAATSAEPIEPITMTYINPLYEDVMTEADLVQPGVMALAAAGDYCDTVEEAGAVIRDQMEARQETVTAYIKTNTWEEAAIMQLMEDMFNAALVHTGVPTEGDYLMWQFGGWGANAGAEYSRGTYYVTVTYTVTYYTTAAQEAVMDAAVEALLAELDLGQASDYDTVKTIYDWVCDNITYDYAHLNDESYLLQFTAYAALVDRTAVCQGYAVLLYRLLLAEGIDVRLIPGYAGGPHAWNIVKLGDVYYNMDATWDAGRSTYDYFLVSPDHFTDHTREPDWDTAEFHAAYPMSDADYDPTAELSDLGDVNRDGKVNVVDIMRIKVLMANGTWTETELAYGDLNKSGTLDLSDVTALKQLILAA